MLMAEYRNCLIRTCGEDVGLPEGTMGNSEVGHQNIGAGRIVYQDSVRITVSIRDGTFSTMNSCSRPSKMPRTTSANCT